MLELGPRTNGWQNTIFSRATAVEPDPHKIFWLAFGYRMPILQPSLKSYLFLHIGHSGQVPYERLDKDRTQDILFQSWPFCSQKNAQFCLKFSLMNSKKKYFVEGKFICESLKLVSNTKENRAKLLFLPQCIKIEISWPKFYFLIFYIRVTDRPPNGPESDQVTNLIRNMILKYPKKDIF